jgi:ketosteroid isomerase-like protein
MATAATAQDVFEAYRNAMERHDYGALGDLFADDAVAITYNERNRPSSAEKAQGRDAIVAMMGHGPDDLQHRLTDEVLADDRLAFTLTCTYPSGELVVANYICDIRAGRIARQIGVEAWDE